MPTETGFSIPFAAIQAGIYTKLNAAVTYGGVAVPVLSSPPMEFTPRRIEIGEDTADAFWGKDFKGWYTTTTIHVWDSGGSRAPVLSIMDSVSKLLTKFSSPISLGTGFYNIATFPGATLCIRDSFDEVLKLPVYHGVLRLKLYIQQATA